MKVFGAAVLFLILLSSFVSAEAVFHGLYTAPFDRFVNLRPVAVNPIVYHGVSRAYYQKVLQAPSGMYYMYYSDINVTSGLTMTSVANSTSGDRFQFVRYAKFSGHPYVGYDATGFGINNNYMLWSWDEVSVGKQSPYKKSIRLYYGNNSDLTGMKDMGWVNFTWMMGTSNNGTISGTYGINKVFYNASGNGLGNTVKDPFGYKFAVYFDCAGGTVENFCVVGSDDPLKFFRTSLRKTLINDTPGAWDNMKLGYGDVVKYKGYNLLWYEGGVADTRMGTGLAYGLNGTKFTRLAGNPILKKSSSPYLNLSVGGASLLIEGNMARLYIAGRNFTGGSYQILEYLYDVRQDKNITISGVNGAASQIMNRTNGVLYKYNASSGGDKVLLLTGLKYNIRVNPDTKNAILIKGLNATNAKDIELGVQTATIKPAGIQALSSVIYSNVTGFDVATVYFNKSVEPTKICSCQYWNTSLAICNSVWSCNATSDYQHGSNSTQYWINVTHFSGYGIGNETPYSPPSVTGVSVSSYNVLQGQYVNVSVDIAKGANDLSFVWFNYNETFGMDNHASEGSNILIFYTDGITGNYTIRGFVNDSNNTVRSVLGPNVNIYTTTTTTPTTTSTTTTTLRGSIVLNLLSGGSSNASGSNFVVTASNSTVLVNQTVSNSNSVINSTNFINAVDYKLSINIPNGNKIIFDSCNFTKVNQSIVVQTSNVSGIKPVPLSVYDGVLASNASNFGKATLAFVVAREPNYVCSCLNWNYIATGCQTGWICNSTNDYQHKLVGGVFYFNVSHFSAYTVGSGDRLEIWDDTNDIQGQDILHHVGDSTGFFANFTNMSGDPINGSGMFCQFMDNSLGGMGNKENMTFNETNKLYYMYRVFGSANTYSFNVTCNGTAGGYSRLSAIDGFVISTYVAPFSNVQWGQVYWWTAEVVAHSITYGIYNSSDACDQLNIYYVEPSPINGFADKIDASTDQIGTLKCQNTTQGVFKISNDGSVGINISMVLSYVPTGVRMKLAQGDVGWQGVCSGVCNGGGCDLSTSCLLINTTYVQMAYNLPQNSSKEYWMWSDFVGADGTIAPLKGNLTTYAMKFEN